MENVRLGIFDPDPAYAKSVRATAEFAGHTIASIATNKNELYTAIKTAREVEEPIEMFLYGTEVMDWSSIEGILAQRKYDKASKNLRALGFLVVRYEKGPLAADWAHDSSHRNIFKVLAEIDEQPEVRPRMLRK